MSIHTAFKAAKPLLREDGASYGIAFICFALEKAQRRGDCSWEDMHSAQAIVSKRLEGHYSLWGWLVAKNHVQHDAFEDVEKLQRTRHAWLDSLIEEFKP